MKKIELKRDCIKKVFEEGAMNKEEYKKFRHAIVCEMKELGLDAQDIKEYMRDWNKRSAFRLNGEGNIRRQLDGYVDWCFRIDAKTGCRSLEDFCLKNNGQTCVFDTLRRKKANQENEKEPYVSEEDIVSHMQQNSLKDDNFLLHAWTWQALKIKQVELELTINDVIFVGFRELAKIINKAHRSRITHQEVCRVMQDLIDAELVILAVKGKQGTIVAQANGYIRQHPTHTNITHMCPK